jgi:WD40 repeat protein
VKVWDSHTGTLVRNFRGHIGLVGSLAFSTDGRLLFSGSWDHTVKAWDTSRLAADALLGLKAESRDRAPELPADPFAP